MTVVIHSFDVCWAFDFAIFSGKGKITKILNLEENQFGKSIITWQNQITKRIKNEWTRTFRFQFSSVFGIFVIYSHFIPNICFNLNYPFRPIVVKNICRQLIWFMGCRLFKVFKVWEITLAWYIIWLNRFTVR